MKRNSIPQRMIPAVLALTLALLTAAACAPQPETAAPQIPLENCQLSSRTSVVEVSARCGTWDVFEDRASHSGRKISLHLAVIKATSNSPAADPLFLLAGGPGEAATEAFAPLLPLLNQINLKRDLVLVDQRGTGRSNPLSCPADDSVEQPAPGEEIPLDQRLQSLQDCQNDLTGDPRFYTTEIAVQDLDEIRQALGYQKINLLGVSYGTRAALTYLRLFPDQVRTLILDGVVPAGWPLGATVSADAQQALDQIFARCGRDPACSQAFPEISAQFDALLADLEKEPVLVELPHPLTAKPAKILLTRDSVAATVRMLSYAPETAALLPLLIHTARTDRDLKPLAAQYFTAVEPLGEAINNFMYLSVTCAEDTPFVEESGANSGYFSYPLDDTRQTCAVWPHAPAAEAGRAPVSADVPVLLVSGGADPVTPPRNAEAAAQTLPQSRHIVLKEMGHGNFYRGCMPKIIEEFLQSGSVAALETGCSQKIQPIPFFTSLAGPQP